ncbi:carboxy terminal-processing peptidase, partial [Escherichia coli]|uniref:carboxy terminal-processing peptidase n=1 Tax=Escherichia coli TaxID=562 RepID=UPI002109A1A7
PAFSGIIIASRFNVYTRTGTASLAVSVLGFVVSLNYAVREKENNEDDATRLARLNERFKREGKPELKKLDVLPKDYQEPDPYLDETVNIALDLAKLEKA